VKIVFVIDTFGPANGGTIATVRLVDELKARGNETVIVTTGKHEGANFYEVPGFAPPGVKESTKNMEFLFGWGKKNVYREAFEGADLVQVQLPFVMARNAVKVAREMGIPVIGAHHVQPMNIISAMGKESALLEKILFACFNFCLLKQVDAIHCPSVFAARMLRDMNITAHLRVISNGIPKQFAPQKIPRPDWFEDRFVLMNVGRHAMEKRQGLLIKGILRSKYKDQIQLILCGRGENSAALRKQGEALPIKPFIDYVPCEDMLTYLNTADLYLHASVVELESLSCLEAIGCGLPCLIGDSKHSASSQFALDERFIFESDNPDALADKIDYWFENRAALSEIKQSVLKMAEMFRFDRCVDMMETFYQDVLSDTLEMNNILPSSYDYYFLQQ
jgi:glycosyltransferase involved in cell wall biosynthesis